MTFRSWNYIENNSYPFIFLIHTDTDYHLIWIYTYFENNVWWKSNKRTQTIHTVYKSIKVHHKYHIIVATPKSHAIEIDIVSYFAQSCIKYFTYCFDDHVGLNLRRFNNYIYEHVCLCLYVWICKSNKNAVKGGNGNSNEMELIWGR